VPREGLCDTQHRCGLDILVWEIFGEMLGLVSER
jgi:hypothetical protein